MRTRCGLEELHEREQAKEEKNRESKRKYIVKKRAVSEKKKRVFFTKVVPLSVAISIQYSEIIRSLSRGFSLQGEMVST